MIYINTVTMTVLSLLFTVGAIGCFMENNLADAFILAFAAVLAFVWLNRLYKEKAQSNVQTQAQLPLNEKSQPQPAPAPMDSVPSASPASVLSAGSYEQKELKAVIVVVVVAIVLFILVGTGIFHQPWVLSAGASEPRFIHTQGTPSSQMYDNRTGQACVNSPVVYDSFRRVRDDFRKVYIQNMDPHSTNPLEKGIAEDPEPWASSAADSLDETDPNKRFNGPEYREFYNRYDALKANPEHPAIYHYDGMPYCKEL